MSKPSATVIAILPALCAYSWTDARADTFACDHIVETSLRAFSVDAELPGGAAAHGGYATPAITEANDRCESDGWESMIRLFADGEGFCAYPGEVIEGSSSTLCEATCRYVVETSLRTIDVDVELPGGAGAHGGYVTPHIALANGRCLNLGWSTMIVTFADGEGYCAYPGEEVLAAGSGPCSATCNFSITTTEREIDVDAAYPNGASEHGGRVLPHLAPANARCLAEGWATMITTFADGEGYCAYPGEEVIQAEAVGCGLTCNFAVRTSLRTLDVGVAFRHGEAAHGGYVLPHLAASNARRAPISSQMISVFADGEGFCALPGEVLLDAAPLGCE